MHKTTLPSLTVIPKPATIGIAPSEFTMNMRESVQHSRMIKRQRERDEKVKKAKGLILNQLYPKYAKDPLIRKIINTEVNEFMKHVRFPIQQNDLSQLEVNIQAQMRPDTLFAFKTGRLTFKSPRLMRLTGKWETNLPTAPAGGTGSRPSTTGSINNYRSKKYPEEEEEALDDDTLRDYAEDAKKTTQRVGQGEMDWTLLQTYYNLKEEEDDERRRREEQERINETNRVRTLQLQEHQQYRQEEEHKIEQTRNEIKKDYEKFKEEERQKMIEKQKQSERIRQIQLTQLRERAEAKEQEAEHTRKQERKEVRRIQKLMEYEEQQAREEKLRRKQELDQIQADNIKNKARLAKEAEIERMNDMRLMKEEKERLDQQELERELWLRKTYDRQQKLAEMNKMNRKEEFMSEEALNARIDQHFREREAELDRIEREKQEEIRRNNEEQTRALLNQMEVKKHEHEEEDARDKEYRRQMIIENKKALEREQAETRRRRMEAEKVRDIQFRQMEENRLRSEYKLSDREREMNKKILNEIKTNDGLRNTLEARMGMYAPEASPVRHQKQTTKLF